MTEWKEGQKVVIVNGYGNNLHYSVNKIDKVLKRTLVLSDKTRWDMQGHQYPKDIWNTSYIKIATPELINKARCQQLARIISKTKFDTIPLEVLEKIHMILKEYSEKKGE